MALSLVCGFCWLYVCWVVTGTHVNNPVLVSNSSPLKEPDFFRMLFVFGFFSNHNSIQSQPWTCLENYTLQATTQQLDSVLPNKQTPGISDWLHTSSTLVSNTGAPQGCVISPLLFMLYSIWLSDIERTRKVYRTKPPSSAALQTTIRVHIRTKTTIMYYSMSRRWETEDC